MATRDRKLSIGRRQQSSASPSPKDTPSPSNLDKNSDKSETNSTCSDVVQKIPTVQPNPKSRVTAKTPFLRKLKPGVTQNAKKSASKKITLTINQKAKRKVNQKLTKSLINSANRVLEAKKLLNKNSAKTRPNRKVKETILDDGPPVLEPIFPIEDNLDRKTTKRRVVRNPLAKKVKAKINFKTEQLYVDTISETIEGVVSGSSYIACPCGIKEEPDSLSESSRSEPIKPKKMTKRQLSLLQKEIKKENIENAETIESGISPNDQKVIDMLDLNVLNVKKLPLMPKRRHTIEKFPMNGEMNDDDFSHFTIFPSLPNITTQGRKLKLRGPIAGKVINPYTISSRKSARNSARLLRNGKQRKEQEKEQLVSLLTVATGTKRKRFHPDLQIIMEYDSDSNRKSPTTPEIAGTPIQTFEDVEIKRELIEQVDENTNTHSTNNGLIQPTEIKRSLSTDYCTDTNSNELKTNHENLPSTNVESVKKLKTDDEIMDTDETFSTVHSAKVPEKLLILDIMKQKFNNDNLETKTINETDTKNAVIETKTSRQDSKISSNAEPEEEKKMSEIISKIVETMGAEEFTATIKTTQDGTALVMRNINGAADWTETKKINVLNSKIETQNPKDEPPFFETHSDSPNNNTILESEEEVAKKENILKALGLQSLKAAEEAKLERGKEKLINKELNATTYTGTLKTVIKLNRDKKKGKQPLKMTLQKNKARGNDGTIGNQDDYKIMKEGSSWKQTGHQSSDTAGAHRKTHYSNRSNPTDGSSEHTSDGEIQNQDGPAKSLVIPEKASSFSIHPERLCKDECTYCFGKFGLFDTPCHIAQIKSVERQDKILSVEKHLTRDSCLCDACYRHIDRKANTPSYTSKSFKRGPMIAPVPKENHCHVLGCDNISTNVLRRKWIIKMKKQICQVINIDLDNPGLHSIPICDEHYIALEHLMVCAMCKRRLARNHIHYLGPEVEDLNAALRNEQVPLKLSDKPVVCKLCKCFSTIILKNAEDRPENSLDFFAEYKKRLLHFNNIVPMDASEAEEPLVVPTKEKESAKKKRKSSKNENSQPSSPSSNEMLTKNNQNQNQNNELNQTNSRPESPSDYLVDYNSLIPSIAMECEEDEQPIKEHSTISTQHHRKKMRKSLDSSKMSENNNEMSTVQRLGSNPSLSVRQLFPGEEDLGLQAYIDFSNGKEKTPEGWTKTKMTLQYDAETKQLWQELQKPYGNQSSFLRHLILLEKYFRNGDLELKSNASQQSINYSESVQNRLRSYDNIPTGASVKPLNMMGFDKPNSRETLLFSSNGNVSITTVKSQSQSQSSSPVTLTQLKNRMKQPPPPPPGLISLLPGTIRPAVPSLKQQQNQQPQSQKIKFPITKNWRPTLIPIDPNKPPPEKKTGLVQVISGGKPFHITLEDYKKMCAIKRSFEMKQKRQQEIQKRNANSSSNSNSSSPNTNNSSSKTNSKSKMPKNEPKIEQNETVTVLSENILEKLDQQVENLESKFNETKLMSMPKIPKSLTVIPQTVSRKNARPASPALLITQKSQTQSLISNCNKS